MKPRAHPKVRKIWKRAPGFKCSNFLMEVSHGQGNTSLLNKCNVFAIQSLLFQLYYIYNFCKYINTALQTSSASQTLF